jgi:hypothetical protein
MVTYGKPVPASGIQRDPDADIAPGAIAVRAVRDARQHDIRL